MEMEKKKRGLRRHAKAAGPVEIGKRKKGLRYYAKIVRKDFPLTLMALPALIVLILFKYLPMFGLVLAFEKYSIPGGIWGSKWVALDNFKYLFSSSLAWQITRNTLFYNLVFIVLDIVIPVAVAIILSEMRSRRLSNSYQTFYMVPYFLSWVVAGFMFYAFLSSDRGLLNHLLQSMGITPVQWYSSPSYWPVILTLLHIWKSLGYSTVMYLSSITSISNDYYEAAILDGATKWQQIRYITLPFLQPMMIVLSILAIGRIFNSDFGMFFNVTRNLGQLYPTTLTIDVYVYNALKNTGDIGMSAAAGLYQSVIGFLLVIASNLIVRRIDPDKAMF